MIDYPKSQKKYDSLAELIEKSSIHGYSNIIRRKEKCKKYTWTLFGLFSTCLCVWFILINFSEFFQFSVYTNVQTIFEQPTQFPTVSFCSNDRVSFRDYNLTNLIKECWLAYNNECQLNPYEHFEKFYSDNYKECFRFNSGFDYYGNKTNIKDSIIGGRDDSLRLKIYSPEGLTVWIHNTTHEPVMEWFDNHNNMNLASVHTETQIIIDKVIETKLGEPYNRCLKDVRSFERNKTIIDFIFSINNTYTQMRCLDYCFELYYYNENPCDCKAPLFDRSWKFCFVDKEQKNYTGCTISYKKKFYSKHIAQKCANYCPLECDSIYYYTSVDSLITEEYINYTYIVVYYRNLKFLTIDQQGKSSITNLISNIGGIFGAFLGLSFLSLIEILEILIEFIFILGK